MAMLASGDAIRAAFPDGLTTPDLLSAVNRAGHALSPEITREYNAALARIRARYPEATRARWKALSARTALRVRTAEPAVTAARRAPGDYDVIASIDLLTVDEILAGLHFARALPHRSDVGAALSAGELSVLMTELRAGFTNIPDGVNVSVGDFRILGGPTSAPIPGTNRIRLSLPIALDIVRTFNSPIGAAIRTVVSEIRGRVRFSLQTDARVTIDGGQPDRSTLSITATLPFPPPAGEEMELEVAPDSPSQPRPGPIPAALALVAGRILARSFGSDPVVQISPFIRLPRFNTTRLLVRQVDVRSVTSATGGALVVGLRIGGAAPEPGDPVRLVDHLTRPPANLYLRVHAQLLQEALNDLLRSGELEAAAREAAERDDLELKSATASIADNIISIEIKGRVVNACGHIVDAPFSATLTLSFRFESDRIVITPETSVGPDWSSGFTYLCILAFLVEGALVFFLGFVVFKSVLAGILFGLVDLFVSQEIGQITLQALSDFVAGADGSGPDEIVIPLRDAIPATELLPRIALVSLQAQSSVQEGWYRLSFAPDNLNYHIYAAFLRRDPFPRQSARPVSGAACQLLDQDAPRPVGDDARVPESTETERISPKRIVTTTVRFVPPRNDDRLGQARTSSEGIAHFIVRPELFHNQAGFKVTEKITEHLDTGHTDIRTTRTRVFERSPDLYFVLSNAQGAVLTDTRNLAPGLLLNADNPQKRVGSASSPLAFRFGGEGILDPG